MEWIESKLEGDKDKHFFIDGNKLLISLEYKEGIWNSNMSVSKVKLNVQYPLKLSEISLAKIKALEFYYKLSEVTIL